MIAIGRAARRDIRGSKNRSFASFNLIAVAGGHTFDQQRSLYRAKPS
jgi:hypothetical protein